jgi:hypothetical protein
MVIDVYWRRINKDTYQITALDLSGLSVIAKPLLVVPTSQ